MGQNMGHLISKSGGKYRDIDIKIMTVSRCQHIVCTSFGSTFPVQICQIQISL